MIKFVNAKINLGLNIVGKRADGYHLLQTIFVPAGLLSGTPRNPEPFCDILELTISEQPSPAGDIRFIFSGRLPNCAPEQNLVVKAARKYFENADSEFAGKASQLTLRLHKLLPDGAGMGGGSADASFTLKILDEMASKLGYSPLGDEKLKELALTLGADCPVFIENQVAYGEGIGEKLYPMPGLAKRLSGKWMAIAKPDLHISTREAFAGVTPRYPKFNLLNIEKLEISEWRSIIHNDFEDSLFPVYLVLGQIKESLYRSGALYASMTGSGASLYGIFDSKEEAAKALQEIPDSQAPYKALILLP